MAKDDVLDEVEQCIDEQMLSDKGEQPLQDEKTSVGSKMTYCRKILRFSRKEMADIFDISPTTLSNYERDRSAPPLKLLLIYSRYFEIPMADFVDDFLTIEEFSVKYCIFHFIKFKTVYKYVNHKN